MYGSSKSNDHTVPKALSYSGKKKSKSIWEKIQSVY